MKFSLDCLQERMDRILAMFEENTWETILKEHPYVEEIVFFGSFMKGKHHEKSDIDIIFVPSKTFVSEEDGEGKLGCLNGIHEDLSSHLSKQVALDVKLQDYFIEGNQFGLTYRTGDLLSTDYEFGKGQVGICAVMDKHLAVTFITL